MGEAWSVIVGAGSAFEDASNPQAVIQAGDADSEGVLEITDIVLSTRGPGELAH